MDRAEYSYDGKSYYPCEEVLRIDTECRKRWNLSSLTGKLSPQPWSVTDECARKLHLRFKFDSEIITSCRLAFERAEKLIFNGEEVSLNTDGWFVDEDISTKTFIVHFSISYTCVL